MSIYDLRCLLIKLGLLKPKEYKKIKEIKDIEEQLKKVGIEIIR